MQLYHANESEKERKEERKKERREKVNGHGEKKNVVEHANK
jgi:hypothetical protein